MLRAHNYYLNRIKAFCKSPRLSSFIVVRLWHRQLPVSLTKWTETCIEKCYQLTGIPVLNSIQAHFTRSKAASEYAFVMFLLWKYVELLLGAQSIPFHNFNLVLASRYDTQLGEQSYNHCLTSLLKVFSLENCFCLSFSQKWGFVLKVLKKEKEGLLQSFGWSLKKLMELRVHEGHISLHNVA